jgi:hypothetical protein
LAILEKIVDRPVIVGFISLNVELMTLIHRRNRNRELGYHATGKTMQGPWRARARLPGARAVEAHRPDPSLAMS